MRAASLSSDRLQRLLAVLKDGKPHTTREILRKANLANVSATISELRQHGAEIDCRCEVLSNRARRFYYTMTKGPGDD